MVTYFEIPVADLERAVAFYTQVLDVEMTRERVDGNEMAHFPEASADGGITGSLALGDSYVPGDAGARIYFAVASIDAVIERVAAAGGRVAYPRTDVGAYGFVAEFMDSEGNRIGLSESGPADD
ncbi:MAG: VOC family protein [Pseudomonadota bacterium]